MTNSKTKKLVVTAVMVALASVLSMIKVWQMPLGGSVTLLSMLPIVLLSIKYGPKWGFFSAFFYSLVQIALDLSSLMSWGMMLKIWIGCIIFDYLVAYTSIGIAGAFRNKGNVGIISGIALALALRFVSHVISGSIFFDIWCPEGWNVYLYALAYNGAYMLPELIFTVVGAAILFKIPQIKKLIVSEN